MEPCGLVLQNLHPSSQSIETSLVLTENQLQRDAEPSPLLDGLFAQQEAVLNHCQTDRLLTLNGFGFLYAGPTATCCRAGG